MNRRAPAVLIVDDDTELSEMLVRLLTSEEWTVSTAATGAAADAALLRERPDVVMLDVMLPDISGMELCRRWRGLHPALGILMLTARGDPIDRVLGLQVGADDYLAKPFEKRELMARLRAVLGKRGQQIEPPPTLGSPETVRGEGGASVPPGAGQADA